MHEQFARRWLKFFVPMTAIQLVLMTLFLDDPHAPNRAIVVNSFLLSAGVEVLALWSLFSGKQPKRIGTMLVCLCLLVALWYFHPWVNIEYNPKVPFDYSRHTASVATTAIICACSLLLTLVSLRTDRSHGATFGVVELAQLLLLFIGIRALKYWPGGEDGPGMAWALFILPLSCLTALVGGTGWCIYFSRLLRTRYFFRHAHEYPA